MGRKLLKIPIIAAGGIGDARGFLGALVMGADAVCFGTAILPTKECPGSESYKNRVLMQNIFDEDFHKKIFNIDYKEIAIGSMASGHIEKSISINEFTRNIIDSAEKIIKKKYRFDTKNSIFYNS